MKKLNPLFAGLLFLVSLPAAAEIKVFACEPEWAALVQELGGDKVSVFTATPAAGPAPYRGPPEPDRASAAGRSARLHRRRTGNRLVAGGIAPVREQRGPAGQGGLLRGRESRSEAGDSR